MGPILGSLIFANVDFEATFYIMGGMMLPTSLIALAFLPESFTVNSQEEDPDMG